MDGAEPSILAIDAGNTRIKWGLHDLAVWRARGISPTTDASHIGLQWNAAARGTKAIASNVAGPEVAAHLERAAAAHGFTFAVIRTVAAQLGVTNGYDEPAQLGTDRWAALIAAHRSMPGHKLVVNVGTALTIDALAGDGRFLGGLIVPGPSLMRRSLDKGTAGLRLTEGVFQPFPASTPNAITTGAIQACVGAVERVRRDMEANGVPPLGLLLSGGGAMDIAAYLPMPATFNENLVLDGLVAIARRDLTLARLLFFLLIIANAAFALHLWLSGSGEVTDFSNRERNRDEVKLVAVTPPLIAARKAEETRETVARLQGSACVEFAGVASADLPRAREAFAAFKLGDRLLERRVEDITRHWVFMPAARDRKTAEATMAELRKKNVGDMSIRPDNTVSLGVFSTEEAARRYLTAMEAKGVRGAQSGPFTRELREIAFLVREPDTEMVARLAILQRDYQGALIRAVTCPQ